MSRIDHLIAEHCPNGVEVKTLGDIAVLVRGNGMPKTDLTESGVGAIHYGQIYTRYGVWTTSTLSFVAPETAVKLAKADPGDLIITNTSENIEDVGKAVAWLGTEQIVTGGHATVIKHHQDAKYLSYWFQSPSFFVQKKALATGTKVIDVSAKQLTRVQIPVPPIEIQREIVRMLDQFAHLKSALESELKAELEARRHQYANYRNSIFALSDGVNSAPMGELGEFIRGRRFTKSDVVEAGIPSIHYGEIYTHYGISTTDALSHVRSDLDGQLRYAEKNDVVIAGVGETVEDVGKAVAWLGDEPVAIHDDTFRFRHEMNPKYVSYFLQSDAFNSQKGRHVSRAKVKRLSTSGLAQIRIPVPSPAEQEQAVTILDELDKLVKELSAALSAELAARRKQYEYYRSLLLTFKELAA